MSTLAALYRAACQPSILRASMKVSLVVGSVLNLINQGGRVLDGLPLSWFHVGLNFLVPFCVASYSAARAALNRGEDES